VKHYRTAADGKQLELKVTDDMYTNRLERFVDMQNNVKRLKEQLSIFRQYVPQDVQRSYCP
jgi:TusA-related sulfurtransferase